MLKQYVISFTLLFILNSPSFSFADESLNIGPQPSWVTQTPLITSGFENLDQIQNGVNYQLLDIQLKVANDSEQVEFRRYVEEIKNRQGLEVSSQINLYFSPEYEKVTLHWVKVYRDGEELDKTSTVRISLLQKEDELENLIYNGVKNYNLIIDDVRVGDVIDYAFSVVGVNPVYQSIFGYEHSLNWGVPVQKLSLRLLWEKNTKLYSQLKNTDLRLFSTTYPSGIEYRIQDEYIASFTKEDNTPSWFDPWASVHFSEAKNWTQVSDWGQSLYLDVYQTNSSIDSKVAEIRQRFDQPAAQIEAALRFVQDEIRYLGLELGENSHRPTKAYTTFERRYGDCKDKTVLFITLLKGLGFDAHPALVNTEVTYQLENSLASARNFDHVITYMEFDNKKWWLDPTRNYQHGDLDSIHQPDYGYALILKPDTESLTLMNPSQSTNGVQTVDNYFLSTDVNLPISVTLDNTYLGKNAEQQRASIDNRGVNQLQNGYLEYLQYYYPKAEVSDPIAIADDKKSNSVQIIERYSIDSMWVPGEEEHSVETTFYPYLIYSALDEPNNTKRNSPLSLTYPKNINQTINVYFESPDWSLDGDSFEETNDFFEFKYLAVYDQENKKLQLNYIYSSKVSYIEPDRYEEYISALNKAQNYQSYGIYQLIEPMVEIDRSDVSTGDELKEMTSIIVFVMGYFLVFLLIIILWRLDRLKNHEGAQGVYYPVSSSKLLFMWVFTFGVYGYYWFYKNFQYIKRRNESKVMPFFRGAFCFFWYYSLWRYLQQNNASLREPLSLIGKKTAIVYALMFLIIMVLSGFDELWALALLLSSVLFVLPLAKFINGLNVSNSKALKYNSRWKFRHILLGVAVLPILLIPIAQEFGLMEQVGVLMSRYLK